MKFRPDIPTLIYYEFRLAGATAIRHNRSLSWFLENGIDFEQKNGAFIFYGHDSKIEILTDSMGYDDAAELAVEFFARKMVENYLK